MRRTVLTGVGTQCAPAKKGRVVEKKERRERMTASQRREERGAESMRVSGVHAKVDAVGEIGNGWAQQFANSIKMRLP
jgi:hypothetical protein